GLRLRGADNAAPARTAKLRLVERFIERHHRVGTVDSPGAEFFRGTIAARWGWFHDGEDFDGPTRGRNTVFFRGESGGHVVMLAGSRRHVLGEQPSPENTDLTAHSATPNIMAVISRHMEGTPAAFHRWNALRSDPGPVGSEDQAAAHDPPEHALRHAADLIDPTGPAEWIEFLAIPLVTDPRRPAVLATPLYVARGRPGDQDAAGPAG
ncbi:DUF7019 family protein, partial [Glycomyces tenuis]